MVPDSAVGDLQSLDKEAVPLAEDIVVELDIVKGLFVLVILPAFRPLIP